MPSCVRGLLALFIVCVLIMPAIAGEQKKTAKTGILLVAFGTTVPEAKVSMDHIDAMAKSRFPGMEIRWAYSSRIVREKLAIQGTLVDSPAQALARMMDDGFTHVAVQSLHTIPGEEFHSLRRTVAAFEGMPKGMTHIELGEPLLSRSDDMERAATALLSSIPSDRNKKDAIVFMGHGTHHPANIYYPGMQYYLSRLDPLALVGTVEGSPSLDDVLLALGKQKPKRVFLMPFMSVAGDHAHNDMAGDEDDSWKSILTGKGYTCIPVIRGTAENQAFVDIWLDHLAAALERLN